MEEKQQQKKLIQKNDAINIATCELMMPTNQIIKASRIKLVIPNFGIIPEGQQGAGNKAWTFIDEIIIE